MPATTAPSSRRAPRPDLSSSQGRELCRWPLLLLPLPLLPLLIALLPVFIPSQRQLLLLSGVDQPLLSRPFRLTDDWLGSAEIHLRTDLPADTSMGLAVELLDATGRVELQLDQEGWRETGTWSEDGESGRYDESRSDLRLELRPRHSGDHRLRLVLEEFSDAAGRPAQPPLRVHLEVYNHRLNGALLLFTSLISAGLVGIFWVSVYGDCRQRRHRRGDGDRLTMGLETAGQGLLRLQVKGRYEKPDRPIAPLTAEGLQVPLRLRLTNAWGTLLFEHEQTLRLQDFRTSDTSWWMAQETLHLRLPEPTALRVWARLPERPASAGLEMEWLELVVEDGVRTPWPVRVFSLARWSAT